MLNSRRSGPVRNDGLEARPDVLTFTSEPLTEAAEVIGEVTLRVRARASGPSFDVFARLCDVDERGRSTSVCDGLVRVAPAAGPGDGWTAITVPMSATAYRFAPGHRIRLMLAGGAHPRFARNTGTGEPIATAVSLRAVDIEFGHDAGPACGLCLPVVPAAATAWITG